MFGTHPSVLKGNAKEKAKESNTQYAHCTDPFRRLGFYHSGPLAQYSGEFLIGSVLGAIIGMIFFIHGRGKCPYPYGRACVEAVCSARRN